MSIAERPPARRSPIRLFALNEITVLGLIAVGFLVVHILAGILLLPAAAGGSVTPREDTSTSFTD
jgi:hypothetical protein